LGTVERAAAAPWFPARRADETRTWEGNHPQGPTTDSIFKYGFRASSIRTTPHFRHTKNILSQQLSVETLNQPSQQVRRELALRERFRGFSCPGRSIGPPKNPGILPSSGGSDGRSERITLKLADGVGFEPSVRPGPHGHPDQTIGYGAPSASQMAYTSTRPGKAARASFLTRKSDPKDNFLILYNRLVSFRPL
jgi:hypothetical protein